MVAKFEQVPQDTVPGNDDLSSWVKSLDGLINDAEGHVCRALENGTGLENDVDGLVAQLKEVSDLD